MIGKAVQNAVSSAVEKQLAVALKENIPPPTSPNLSMQGVKKKEKKKTETAPVSPPPACAASFVNLTAAALQQLSSALQKQFSSGQQLPMQNQFTNPNQFYAPPSSPPYPNPYSPSGGPFFCYPNYAPSAPSMPPYTPPPGWHY
jgi:hypothetical protein